MSTYQSYLNEIHRDQSHMVDQLIAWSNINSGSDNLDGLAQMLAHLKRAFSILGAKTEQIKLPDRKRISAKGHFIEIPTGDALRLTKHPRAPLQIILAGHMDTVYPIDSPFQKAEKIHAEKICGPGVTDMKGGLLVLLKALETLEKSPMGGKIGWQVIINPDEEVGSCSSEPLFLEAAKKCHLGFIFEPAFPDGSLVSARKGSANFSIIAYGKSAHAGRDFFEGKNAITALARFIVEAEKLIDPDKGIILNIGRIEGGTATNIVPELASCHINARISEKEDLELLKIQLKEVIQSINEREKGHLTLHDISERVPKPFGPKEKKLFNDFKETAEELNIQLNWRSSGGVCDGNILAAAGLPTIDTLGVVGGQIHTFEEYMIIDSLTERAQMTSHFLMKLAEKGKLS